MSILRNRINPSFSPSGLRLKNHPLLPSKVLQSFLPKPSKELKRLVIRFLGSPSITANEASHRIPKVCSIIPPLTVSIMSLQFLFREVYWTGGIKAEFVPMPVYVSNILNRLQ